jgi:cytidine deaminase
MNVDEQAKDLVGHALVARETAYAPYSGYPVGAALLDRDGRLWTGCNVENVSFGLTMCAERVAIGKMVSAGSTRLSAVAVATRDGGTPCGACLQVLSEFVEPGAEVPVLTVSEHGDVERRLLSDLLPHGFRSRDVIRTDDPVT